MELIKLLVLGFFCCLIVLNCDENNPNDLNRAVVSKETTLVENKPELLVQIELDSSIIFHESNILINLNINNTGKNDTTILYDHPEFMSYGPWGTSVDVFNQLNDSLVIEFPNAATLSSQFYSLDELEEYYEILPLDKAIEDEIYLYDIIYTGDRENRLKPGEYYMQLTYLGVKSNTVSFNLY